MEYKVKPLLNSKEKLSSKDYQKLQDYIILCLTCGIFIPPRRSLDWTEFKINSIDRKNDNFMDKNKFIFNRYKSDKFYSTQEIEIPKELKNILNKFLKHNNYDYLLVDKNGQKLSSVKLSQKLNNIFDSKISTSMLRHIYLSNKLEAIPKLNELKELANDMGHSVSQQLLYIKK